MMFNPSPQAVSDFFGFLSIGSWLFAQLPQLIENFRNGSTESLAVNFLVAWFLGDFTNLIGCLLTGQLPFQSYLATYFVFIDICLVFQYIYYTYIHPPPSLKLAPSSATDIFVNPNHLASSPSVHSGILFSNSSRPQSIRSTAPLLSHPVVSEISKGQVNHPRARSSDPLLSSGDGDDGKKRTNGAMHFSPVEPFDRNRNKGERRDFLPSSSSDGRPSFTTRRMSDDSDETVGGGGAYMKESMISTTSSISRGRSRSYSREPTGLGREDEEQEDDEEQEGGEVYDLTASWSSAGSYDNRGRSQSRRHLPHLPPSSSSELYHNHPPPAASGLPLHLQHFTSSSGFLPTITGSPSEPSVLDGSAIGGGKGKNPIRGSSYHHQENHNPWLPHLQRDVDNDETEGVSTGFESVVPHVAASRREGSRGGEEGDDDGNNVGLAETTIPGKGGGRRVGRSGGSVTTMFAVWALLGFGILNNNGGVETNRIRGKAGSDDPGAREEISRVLGFRDQREAYRIREFQLEKPTIGTDENISFTLEHPHHFSFSFRHPALLEFPSFSTEGLEDDEPPANSSSSDDDKTFKSQHVHHRRGPIDPDDDNLDSGSPSKRPDNADGEEEPDTWSRFIGKISAWACAFLYLASRMPQIYKNWKRKSVEGLSILLFCMAFAGNLFYVLSIVLNPLTQTSKTYLHDSIPYLLGSGGTLSFDCMLIFQFLLFRPIPPSYSDGQLNDEEAVALLSDDEEVGEGEEEGAGGVHGVGEDGNGVGGGRSLSRSRSSRRASTSRMNTRRRRRRRSSHQSTELNVTTATTSPNRGRRGRGGGGEIVGSLSPIRRDDKMTSSWHGDMMNADRNGYNQTLGRNSVPDFRFAMSHGGGGSGDDGRQHDDDGLAEGNITSSTMTTRPALDSVDWGRISNDDDDVNGSAGGARS